jgi:hypothetical protein
MARTHARAPSLPHTHTHNTHTHTHTHACAHTHTPHNTPPTHARTHSCVHTHAHTTHTNTHTHTHTHTSREMHPYNRKRINHDNVRQRQSDGYQLNETWCADVEKTCHAVDSGCCPRCITVSLPIILNILTSIPVEPALPHRL